MANSEMGCYKHPDQKVVGTCVKCGKFLCKECTEKYESHLCEDCEKERLELEKKKRDVKQKNLEQNAAAIKQQALKDLVSGVIISLIFAFIGFSAGKSDGNGLTMGYMLAGFPWGYKFINKLMDDGVMFFAALAGNWLVAVFIKLVLGMLIGAITWPFILGYRVYKFIQANNLNKEIKSK